MIYSTNTFTAALSSLLFTGVLKTSFYCPHPLQSRMVESSSLSRNFILGSATYQGRDMLDFGFLFLKTGAHDHLGPCNLVQHLSVYLRSYADSNHVDLLVVLQSGNDLGYIRVALDYSISEENGNIPGVWSVPSICGEYGIVKVVKGRV